MMIGDTFESGALLRMIGAAVQGQPDWFSSAEKKKDFADRIHEWIVNSDPYIVKKGDRHGNRSQT